MAFTREFIRRAAKESGVEIPKELEDALVNEHISARDAYASAQVEAVKKPETNVKDSEEYKQLKKDFDDYKAEQGKKESRASKEAAYRAILKEAGISEKRIDAVLRVSDVDGVELDENGAIKGATDLKKSIKNEWSDFITTTQTKGAEPANPPANGGGTRTRADIYKKDDKGRYIMSTAERQAALAESFANGE